MARPLDLLPTSLPSIPQLGEVMCLNNRQNQSRRAFSQNREMAGARTTVLGVNPGASGPQSNDHSSAGAYKTLSRRLTFNPMRILARPVLAIPTFALALVLIASPFMVPQSAAAQGIAVTAPIEPHVLAGRALDATVVIETTGGRFLGSGFVVGAGRQVLTNAHVVAGQDSVVLRGHDGQKLTLAVTRQDARRDMAVIDLPEARFGPGLVLAAQLPDIGASVWALGAPLGIDFTLTAGIVSAAARYVDVEVPLAMIQHDAAVNPGSSGGPLIGADGQVLGMNSQIADGSRLFAGIAYAIPAPVLAQFLADELPDLVELGVQLRPVSPDVAAVLGLPGGAGALLVENVSPDGLAAWAGLTAGDVILAINDTPLQSPQHLAGQVEALAGQSVALEIWRDGGKQLLGLDLVADEIASRELPKPTPSAVHLSDFGMVIAPDGTISEVARGGHAFLAGLDAGDVIVALNGQAFSAALLDLMHVGPVVLRLERAGLGSRHIILDPRVPPNPLRSTGGGNSLDASVVFF